MNYISQITAQKSKVYFIKPGTEAPQEDIRIEVDFNEFLAYEKRFKSFFGYITGLLNQSGQSFCEIRYEELLKPDHKERLLKFLEVNSNPDLLKARSEKQNKLPLEQKIINYDAIRKQLIEAGMEKYLEEENV
jgi:hypothetical protein